MLMAQTSNVNITLFLPLAESEFAFFLKSVQVVIAASQSVWFTKQTYFACHKKIIYSRGT